MMTYRCPQCGQPGAAISSLNGFTELVCIPCRLFFEQPTNYPADAYAKLDADIETTALHSDPTQGAMSKSTSTSLGSPLPLDENSHDIRLA